jgi:hypothetical protein
MSEEPPALDFVRRPCPKCGSRTERQAESRCRPTQGYDGDYHCPGGEDWRNGWRVEPTARSIKRLDDYYGRLMAAEEREAATPPQGTTDDR